MDYKYLYSTRIQKIFDEDQADILSILKAAIDKKPKLEIHLINYYKGMPVSYTAKLVAIEKGSVDLDVTPEQAVAISSEYYTFIRSKLFKYDVLANAQYVNIKKKAVSLRKFCYVEIMAERRKYLRLELAQPVNATFMSSTGIVIGNLIELSLGGVVIEVSNLYKTEIGEEASINFTLSDTDKIETLNIEVPAKLENISYDHKPLRYIFTITLCRIADKKISKWLYNRQIEIINELKDRSDVG